MRQFLSAIILLVFFSVHVSAQDSLIVLHPSVGNKITLESKKKYLLFPEIRDSLFQSCIIKQVHEKYYVTTTYVNNTTNTSEVSVQKLQEYRDNIQKLDEYYSNKNHPDSNSKIDLSSPAVNKDLATPGLTDQQKEEIIRDERLKSDQERMKNYQQGTETSPTNIEIYNSGKKKKKK